MNTTAGVLGANAAGIAVEVAAINCAKKKNDEKWRDTAEGAAAKYMQDQLGGIRVDLQNVAGQVHSLNLPNLTQQVQALRISHTQIISQWEEMQRSMRQEEARQQDVDTT
ncbi:MAG: hypothetical protein GOMPHAMPRED_000721 [Gomphillus americanus]|uniref:Uncharacterized protein n=1 Tax=Gomphillus americanus TaxID=1940652 RepID=A0A8H3IGZ6_9LECA|nr:MAG: hypothetical protein GOMPHAMPRED_000721 [Gomphillus americanus]